MRAVGSVAAACEGSDIVFLSLPSGEIVRDLAREPNGLLAMARPGQTIVDLGTSPVDITRTLAAEFAQRGARFVDAPVARTRAAAEAGTLAVMVGGDVDVYERVLPLLAAFASDITHCGPVGCGQVVKILNNMVLFETVVAISEAKAIGERAGVDPAIALRRLVQGLGRQLRPAQPRHESGVAGRVSASGPSRWSMRARIWPTRCSSRAKRASMRAVREPSTAGWARPSRPAKGRSITR